MCTAALRAREFLKCTDLSIYWRVSRAHVSLLFLLLFVAVVGAIVLVRIASSLFFGRCRYRAPSGGSGTSSGGASNCSRLNGAGGSGPL